MYRAFFNLKFDPFTDPQKIGQPYLSDSFLQLQDRLDFVSKTKGFVLITGSSGVGKTFFLHHWVNHLDPNLVFLAYLPLATISNTQFFTQLCLALEIEPKYRKIQMFTQIQQKILNFYSVKKILPLIVIDDLQLMRQDILLDLPLIFNFSKQAINPFILILLAHPFFKDKIKLSTLDTLKTRINLFFQIQPLSLEQTLIFLQHSLAAAAANPNLFSQPAAHSIFELSGGLIRVINNLCHHALLAAFANKHSTIQGDDVLTAANEIIMN